MLKAMVASRGFTGICSRPKLARAKAEAKNLLKIKPEFHSEGRRIIQILIKEEALVARITEGLRKGGITLT